MSDSAIEIKGVTKRFRDKVAVDALDLAVPVGTVCGFVGPNGAGKTTTIRMVMSIFYPDQGDISVLGHHSAIDSKNRIGYLPEERGVYRKMKVGAFLTYIAKLKGVDSKGLSKRIDDWLDRVALPGVRAKRCEELSKGMQQKVQFIATVIHNPDLIIFDEVFSGLDPVNARLIRELINELHREGKTIIFSTHVLQQAEQICDRIFMIDEGKKILDATMDEIREKFDPRTVLVEPAAQTNGHADIIKALNAIEGIHTTTPSREKGVAEAHLDPTADVQRVISKIVSTLPVRRVELRRVTLEDVFVQLVDAHSESEAALRATLGEDPGPETGAAVP